MNTMKLTPLVVLLIPAAVLPAAFAVGTAAVAAVLGVAAGLTTASFALYEAERRRQEPAPVRVRAGR